MMSNKLLINEVGPRDGLQNQPTLVSAEDKLKLIRLLQKAGLKSLEVGSFVSPKAVPQMATTEEVVKSLGPSTLGLSVLIPNMRGFERAKEVGVSEVAVVLSATETMNVRNINMSLEKTVEVCEEAVCAAKASGIRVKAYVAVAFECPFEGPTSRDVLYRLTQQMFDAGADEVVIADTIGAAAPMQVREVMTDLVASHGADRISGHFHDTRGMALATCFASIEAGIRRFDSSIGGMGGCPFTPNAAGNLATEDLALMASQSGFDTGIKFPELIEAIDFASFVTQRELGGRSAQWLKRRYQVKAAA
jgi:hydroxymethylglutaryl-CoA lyase